MSIERLLLELQQGECQLAIPKRRYPYQRLTTMFGQVVGKTDGSWLVSCRHVFNPPASLGELVKVRTTLGFRVPDPLARLLHISNGAELFSVQYHYAPDHPEWDSWIPRYQILAAADLAVRYQDECQHFRARASNDPEYQSVAALNYLPFCDVADGNCLAWVLTTQDVGRLIYVDREAGLGAYYPYDAWTRDKYVIVADSLESWLEELIETKGWGDPGVPLPPL